MFLNLYIDILVEIVPLTYGCLKNNKFSNWTKGPHIKDILSFTIRINNTGTYFIMSQFVRIFITIS